MNTLTRQLIRASLPARRAILRRRLGRVSLEEADGLSLVILPQVFNPVVFRTGVLLARAAESVASTLDAGRSTLSVLDVGTGSGIGGLYAARSGAIVTAVDINPEAVRCARINAMVNHLDDRVTVVTGDLFHSVAGQTFDLILFNPPFFRGAPRDNLDRAWRAEAVIERFANDLAVHLAVNGVALVAFSSDGDEEGLLTALREAGLNTLVHRRHDLGNEVVTIYAVTAERGAMTAGPQDLLSAALHDRLAPDYERPHAAGPWEYLVRAAFRELVEEHVEPGDTLLDFGCGTGDDCLYYSWRGMRVVAYDNSEAMLTELRRKCADPITVGRVIPIDGPYEHFLTRCATLPRVRAVTANFAVLNMIQDLRALFRELAECVEPGGVVIASVLNPVYWRDLRHPGRWRWIGQAVRDGVALRRGEVVKYCHSRRAYARACAPMFRLEGRRGVAALVNIERGAYDWSAPHGFAQRAERALWRSAALAPIGKFWFLVFRRVA